MSGHLLDTSAALIALSTPDQLPLRLRKAILAGPNFLSVVSYWEVLLKNMKGLLEIGDPRGWWSEAIDQLGASPLPLRPEHVSRVYTLPAVHKDPFDRMLIAQAIAEDLDLVTTDRKIVQYASDAFHVLH